MIKSPLRYPGGKSRGIAEIAARMPPAQSAGLTAGFCEYREPMVGGASVLFYVRQTFPDVRCWINDLNPDLVYFWQATQNDANGLADELHRVRDCDTEGRALFDRLKTVDKETLSPFERAVRFFVLNRITFSGTIEAGGYSQGAFDGRFTHSAIERVRGLSPILAGVRITHGDYAPLLSAPRAERSSDGGKGQDVFVFLDPPYLTATHSKLYGAKGSLHTGFDHERFAALVKACPHNCLITYDDAPALRETFADSHLYSWGLQYGMNNVKRETAAIGKELMISNYAPEPSPPTPLPRKGEGSRK